MTEKSIHPDPRTQLVLALLDGQNYGGAMMSWHRPGPIHLPDDPAARRELVEAHITGSPADLIYSQTGKPERIEHVEAVQLFALCPGADWLCRWLAFDLDAAEGHGTSGLVDPARAARCIAERAHAAGLGGGLLAVRSRRAPARIVANCWQLRSYATCGDGWRESGRRDSNAQRSAWEADDLPSKSL